MVRAKCKNVTIKGVKYNQCKDPKTGKIVSQKRISPKKGTTKKSTTKRTRTTYSKRGRPLSMKTMRATHKVRSSRAKKVDYGKDAKKTYKPSNARGTRRWNANPNRFDMVGIDTKKAGKKIKKQQAGRKTKPKTSRKSKAVRSKHTVPKGATCKKVKMPYGNRWQCRNRKTGKLVVNKPY